MKLSTWGRPASKPGFGWQAYVFQNRVNQPGSWNFRFDFRRPVLYRRYPLHTTPAHLGARSLINEWPHARVTWVSLREHGCTYQCATRRLADFDVPPHADVYAVIREWRKRPALGVCGRSLRPSFAQSTSRQTQRL